MAGLMDLFGLGGVISIRLMTRGPRKPCLRYRATDE